MCFKRKKQQTVKEKEVNIPENNYIKNHDARGTPHVNRFTDYGSGIKK